MTKEVSTTVIPPTQDRRSLKVMTFEWDPSEAKENPKEAPTTTESTDKTTESLAVATTDGGHTLSALVPKPPPIWDDDGDEDEHGGGGGKGGGGGPYEDGRLGEALAKILSWIIENIPNWFPVFDKAGRAAFTQGTVKEMWDNNTDTSVGGFVITYVDYSATRAIWSSNVNFGNMTYTLLAFPYGQDAEFVLDGDGGYINWAVIGYFNRYGNRISFY